VKQKVRLRWSWCLQKMLDERGSCLTREFVARMLAFLHELGVVVHFGSSDSSVFRSLVVLQSSVALVQPVLRDLQSPEQAQ